LSQVGRCTHGFRL